MRLLVSVPLFCRPKFPWGTRSALRCFFLRFKFRIPSAAGTLRVLDASPLCSWDPRLEVNLSFPLTAMPARDKHAQKRHRQSEERCWLFLSVPDCLHGKRHICITSKKIPCPFDLSTWKKVPWECLGGMKSTPSSSRPLGEAPRVALCSQAFKVSVRFLALERRPISRLKPHYVCVSCARSRKCCSRCGFQRPNGRSSRTD